MESISSLFPNLNLKNPAVKILKKRGANSQRAELTQWIFERVQPSWKAKRPLDIKYFCFKISFLKTDDLFYIQSQMKDIARRSSKQSAIKYFWWCIKPENANELSPSQKLTPAGN